MSNKLFTTALLICAAFITHAQLNIDFVGQLTYDDDMSNVWGWTDPDGNEFVIAGTYDGTSLVDITDPADPTEVQFINGDNSIWRQISTWDHYAYVVNETGGGLLCIDLSSLPGTCTYNFSDGGAGIVTSHQVWADENGIIYLFGSNLYGGATVMLDATVDPLNPTFLGSTDTWYVHHGFARGDTLWESNIYQGWFSVWDVSDKAAPVLLATQTTPGLFTHNVVVSTDGNYLFSTDEVTNGSLGAYDVSDLSDIQFMSEFRANPGTNSIPHYAWVKDNYVVTAWYRDGLIITDVSNPAFMVKTGEYDTNPLSGNGFNGAWGAYPYFPSGNIAVTDIEEGLFILSPTYTEACFLNGTVTNASTAATLFGVDVAITGASGTAVTTNFSGEYLTGLATAGTYTVTFFKAGFEPLTVTGVALENGTTVTLDAELVPYVTFPYNGQVVDAVSGAGIAGADVLISSAIISYSATTDASGNFTLPSVIEDTYDVYAGKWSYKTKAIFDLDIDGSDPLVVALSSGYYDDFLFDNDWTNTSTAETGDWVKGEPIGTLYGAGFANPDFDVNDDYGDECYVTGNGGGSSGTDDVDDGTVTLISPVFDLSDYDNAYISFEYWWFNNGGTGGTPNDTLKLRLENGTTSATIILDAGLTGFTLWADAEFRIADYITPTATMNAKFITSDLAATGHVVEAAIDKFFVFDSLTSVPTAAFTQTATDVCAGEMIGFADMSLLATAWEWSFEGGTPSTSSIANPLITYNTPGVYNVTLTASNGLGSDVISYTDLITVFANPAITLSAGIGEASVAISGGATPYTIAWSNGGTTETITGLPVGDYSVTVTDANGCSAEGNVTVTQSTAIENLAEGIALSVYPNPVGAYFSLDLQTVQNYNNGEIRITDVQGKLVWTDNVQANTISTVFVEALSAGVYNCVVIMDNIPVARFQIVKTN